MEWVDVYGYAGIYKINTNGVVVNAKTSKAIKPIVNRAGYLRVGLYSAIGRKFFLVHRLVMYSFIGVREGLEINHLDGNKSNNSLDNLTWVSRSENMKHLYSVLLEKPHNAVVVAMVSLDGFLLNTFNSCADAAKQTGLDYRVIANHVRLGATKAYGGFLWM